MKTAKLGDYFLWMGKIANIISIVDGQKVIGFTTEKTCTCPYCGKQFDSKVQHSFVESSPHFQENAQPISTLNQ